MGKKKYEVIFVLDMSGSMNSLRKFTVDGYNSMLHEQKSTEKDARVTTVFFNDYSRYIHKRVPISEVEEITFEDYVPDGCTALYDAIGQTATEIREAQQKETSEGKEIETLFVITTDGRENASKEFTGENVSGMIRWLEENLHWEFVFMGAGLKTEAEAKKLKINDSVITSGGIEGQKVIHHEIRRKLKDFLN